MNHIPSRFSRQADLVPQDRLASFQATVIGVGAIGRQVALQLAAIGTPRIQLIDFDVVDATNITTQGFFANEVGMPKVTAVTNTIMGLDDAIRVDAVQDRYRCTLRIFVDTAQKHCQLLLRGACVLVDLQGNARRSETETQKRTRWFSLPLILVYIAPNESAVPSIHRDSSIVDCEWTV
jgi:hypothetical protein